MICPNTNTIEWKSLVAKIGELQAWKEYIKNGNEIPTLGQLESINKEPEVIQFQKLFPEEQFLTAKQLQQRTAIEQSVKDTAEKMSAKIGIPFRYIRETQTLAKGWIENGEAVINLAYATLDTPIHEILGHPIVRAIKNEQNNYFEQTKHLSLYQNLLKELETGKGKEVLDRVKRDYKYKDEKFVKHLKLRLENTTLTLEERNDYQKHIDSQIYSLEEQQEEAIVTLLGKLTEGKLDKVKDKNLISLLKELLSQMTAYMRSLFNSKELDISKLKADITLNDLANLLAYSNSKIILPGSKVEYTTPDGTKHSTYQEASNHISKLFNESKDVDLSNIKVKAQGKVSKIEDVPTYFRVTDGHNDRNIVKRNNNTWYVSGHTYDNFSEEKIEEIKNDNNIHPILPIENYVIELYNKSVTEYLIGNFIEKNKPYEQAKEIIETWKKENNIIYNPEEVYSRGQGFYSSIGAYSTVELDLLLQNLLIHIEDNKKANGEFTISAFTKPIDKRLGHLEKESSVRFVIYPKSKDIKWAAPTDVYSGSVWDASQKVSKDKKSELLGVSFTKAPSLQNINEVSPNLADIIDNLAHHHNELGIELTGTNFRLEVDENVPYEIKKLVNSVNSILDSKYGKIVKPEIKESDKEIIKVELSDPYTTKFSDITFNTEQEAKNWIKIESEKQDKQYDEFDISSENKFTYKVVKIKQGIQPTKTKDNVSSIGSIANKLGGNPLSDFTITKEEYEKNIKSRTEEEFRGLTEDIEPFKEHAIFEGQQYRYFDENGRPYFRNVNNNTYIRRGEPKEYTSQALTNLKIAALKEVAKKHPRSLITSKVIAVNQNNERQYSKIDLLESISELKDDVTLKEQLEIVDSLTSAVLVSYADVLGTKEQISIEQAIQQTIDGLPNLANEYSAEGNTVMANRITRLISRLNETTEFTGYKNLIKDRISALKYKVIEDPEFDDNLTSGEVYDKANSERDPETRMSAKTKRFLTFIPVIDDNGNSEANYLGLEKYYDFNDLYKGLLSNTSDKSAEDVMLTLKELSNNNNMYKSTLFKFNELPQDEKNSIISVLIKQSAKFKMLQFYPADAQGRVSIEVINSNRATAEDSLMEDWNNNFSTLVDKKIGNEPLFYKNTDESGFTYYNINQNAGKLLYVAFKTASDSYLANKATEEVKLKAIDTMVGLFNEIGIKVQPVTIYTILNKGKLGNIKGTPTELLRGKLAFIFEGLFTQLDSNGKVNVIKTADEDSNDIFKTENVTIKNLAISHNRIFNAKQTESFTNSEGNSTYPFIERHYLNAALAELKNTNSALYQALSKDNFTKDSLWLKNISNLDIFYTDGLKNAKKKNRFGKTYENLSDKERLLMRYALFQNQGKKETFFVYPTPSDKTTFPLISAIKVALNYNGSPSIDNINEESDAFKALLQLAFSELYRVKQTIAEIKVNKPEGKISGYHTQEKTGKRFFFFTGLNDIFASQIENEEDIFITDDNIKLITAEIKNHLNQLYDKEKAKLISEGILNEAFTKSSFDKSYITKIQEQKNENIKLITTEDINKHAIIDYLVNDMIALGNIYQLFVGDPAQLTKSISDDKLVGMSSEQIVDNTIVNVFKRISKDIAPGREGVFNTSHYNTIFIHEPISYSSLGDKYKEYAKKLDAADAQEWVTPEEYIDNLFAYGEVLSEDEYNTLKKKLKNQEEFTDEELGLVLQPTKPVYVWRQAKGQNDPLLMTYYIKTSAFPLLPQLVRGTQLENLYKIMKDNNIQRAVVKSGVKAGFSDGVRVFEENGEVVSKEKLQKYLDEHPNSIKSLDRKGFRIQQNVPYDENKNSILLGTQLAKLIFANLNSKWDFNGKTGAELKQEFDKLVSKLTDIKYNAFLEAYKITPTQNGFEIGDLDKFLESMKKLAIQKGFNYNDLLQLKTIVKNGKKVFEINPFFNTKYKEVESLFTSMVSNEIMKRKLPGRSYVQGSSVGFVSQREQGIKSIEGKTKDELKSISGIVYTNDWKGDLDYRIDENGGIYAEILVPFNFFDNKGKKLDIKDYTNKDGTLDIKRFDSELLESIGYRIPTQGHMSMVKMKIVGFLPASSGDLMIVPAAITKQMGSDFDVDKVYNHTFNHELIGNTIKKIAYTEGSNNEEEVQNRIIEIFKQILENPKAAQLVAKTLSSDPLKDAVDEVRAMKGITAESHLGLLDRQFNDSQVSINRDGKVMIGISSLSSVHHALSQHANLYLAESEEFLPVMFADENGLVYTDVGGSNNVNDYTDYVGQPQVGAWRLDKIFGFSGIPILDTIAYIQTAATDNAKDPILGKGNINKHTANVALFIARSGFNDKWISNFLMQDSLITLSKRFDSQLDDITDMSYVANKRDVIVQELRDELQAQYVSLGGNAETAKMLHVFKLSELKALNEESANPGVKSRDYYLYQLQILANFEMWDKTSKELGKIQNALNFETKGLGKDLFGVTRKLQLLNQTDIIIRDQKLLFINADKLIEGTFIGNILNKGVRFAETLFNNAKLFPYKNPIINDIYKSIKENSNRKHLDVLSEEFADTINEHIRFSIFSKLAEKLDERSINDLRNSLLFGKEALGNQIIALKQELQDEPDSPGMNFLNKLSISKQKNSADPILVEFPNSLKVSDTQSLLNSLGWLDLYNGPHTKEIAIQMVKYSFAIGNERSIHDFGRFLPYDMQKDLGIIDALNSVNYEMFGIMRDNFVTQFFQHSPEFAPQFKDEDVTVDVKDKNTFTLNAEVIKSYTASTDENNQPNTPIILTKFEQQEGRKKSKLNVYLRNGNTFTYTKIDTLGATGINEYDLMMSYGQSFLPQNQVKSRPVKQPVVKPVESMAKAEMPQLAAPKKELATTTQSTTTPSQTGQVKPADFTNHSGGAYGGDTFWDIIGRTFGVTKHKHYKDSGNPNLSQKLKNTGVTATILTKEQMDVARTEVEKLLGKKYPDTLEGNLQVRNYYQVANSDGVFAISKLNQNDNGVTGGTNTAVQLGIKLNKPVYVWDITSEKWFVWNAKGQTLDGESNPTFEEYYELDAEGRVTDNTVPKLTKNFAGVGSRDIESYNTKDKTTGEWKPRKEYLGAAKEAAAKQAIRDVYENTFKPTQSATSVETTQVNITGLLQSIAANGEYQGLAAYILENNKAFLPNIEIKYGKIDNGSRGRTEYFNDKILITIDNTHPANLKEAGFREVLMHEVMHALTKAKVEQYYSGKLENLTEEDIKAIKQLEQVTRQIQYLYSNTPLYNVQLEMKVKNMSMSDSMARNVKELVAYSFTDKDIKAFLNGQKGLDQKKSLWERFKGIILKLLGLQNINEDSLLANTALAVFELQKNPLFSESTIVDNKEDNLPSQTYANDLDLFNRFIKGLMNQQGISMRIHHGNIDVINNRQSGAAIILAQLNKAFAQFGKIAEIKPFPLRERGQSRTVVHGLVIDPIVLKKYNDYITGLNTDFLVSNQLTKYEKTIEQLKSQIKILEKRKSEGKSDYYEINSKIDAIDAKIKAIEAKYNDQNLFKQAKSQISEVTQNIRAINLQLSEDMTSENVMKAMNILMESDNVIKGWLSIDEFMDYSTGTVEKKTWNSIKTLLTEQRKEYLDVLKRAYTKYNSEILKRSDSNSLFSSVTDISGMSREMLDISTSDVSLLKSVHEAVNRSRREKDQELISAEKQIEDIFQRLETITGKKGLVASDVFLQKDSNGKWTGALVKEFLNEFYQKRNKLKAEAQESGEWGEYYAFINANTHTITQAEFESKSNSVFNTEDYQKQTDLLERYAKREKVEREKLESLKEQAQHELDGDQITQEEYNNKILELDKSIAIWVSTNSPYAYWAAKKAKRSTKGMYGFNYIFNKPISKWLDPSYKKIKSDPKLFGLYNEIKDFFYQNDKNVPNNLYGMLPELSKTFVEKMKEDGTMSLLSSTSDWMKNLYSEDIANSKESDIRIGNNVIKSIPVSMMGNHLAIEDKSRDLKAILKAHTATSLHYKHMSQVQPIASAAEQLLAEIKAIKKVGGKVLTDSSGNPIELVGGLLNARAQLEYYIDTVIYKRSKLQEAVSNKKTYSTKDKELIKELDKQLKEGKITQEEYDISNEKLGQNITGSKIGDTVITYTFLKALGLNPISPIVNGTFAFISNFTHSAGKVDFDTPSAMRALKVILSSLTQSVTFDALKSKDAEKLYAFSSRLGIMHDVSEGTVAKNLVDKVMKMQSKSEFAGVAQSMTATLMYQKLKDKNGKDVSVWDAYKVVNDELVWDTDKMGAYIEPAINELFSKERKGVNMYKMHARVTQMNKFLHGNYRDPMKLKKTITGRAVSLFRTWLPMSVAERFGKEYFDDSLGRIKKGRYRSVATAFNQDGLIKTLTRIVKGQLFLNNTEGLEDVDVENIRKVNAELRSIMFLSAIAIMLKAIAGDDDDDKTSLYMALNVINRTYADITFFTNPNSANQIFKNAIPAFKTITDFTDIFLAVPGLIDGTDTYKTGHRKGKSKMGKEIIENIMIVNQWDKLKSAGSYLYENMR